MDGRRRRGRPLDRSRDQCILETTVDLLGEVGFEGFRVHDVAERAGVGLGTIYRRWPTRDSLIVAAFESAVVAVDADDTRDLDGFRRQLLGVVGMLHSPQADLLPGLIATIHRDRDLAETFRATLMDPRMAALQATVHAAAAVPLGDEVADLIAKIGPGVLLLRLLLIHEPVSDDVIDRITNDLIAPLLAQHARQAAEA